MEKIRVLIDEDQEILREAYETILSREPSIDLIGLSDEGRISRGDREELDQTLKDANPDIILLGIKTILPETMSALEMIHTDYPNIGVILLFGHYSTENIGRLRGVAKKSKRGAYLLKSSINTAEELIRLFHDISIGRVIVDPQVFAGLIQDDRNAASPIKELTARELEVLQWLSSGYRNSAIAQILYLEPKTVERHIGSIFSKLSNGDADLKHPRVEAALSYLSAAGKLSIPTPAT